MFRGARLSMSRWARPSTVETFNFRYRPSEAARAFAALPVQGQGSKSQFYRINLSPLGLTADRGDRDMPHRRVGLGSMPMALAGLDVNDVADIDCLRRAAFDRDHAGAGDDDQNLIAGMGVPAGSAALAEIDHTAVVIVGVAGLDDGLARARNRACPPLDPV